MSILKLKPNEVRKVLNSYWLPAVIALASGLTVISPILSNRILNLWGLKFSGGLAAIMITYCLIDVINEKWGRATASASVIILTLTRLLIYITIVPLILSAPFAFEPKGFSALVHQSFRTMIAGEISVLIAGIFIDVPVFAWLKKKSKNIFFVRSNMSNFISSFLAAIVFVVISYAGTGQAILSLIITQFIARNLLSVIITPFTSLLTRAIKTEK